jgi:hypothetical protein
MRWGLNKIALLLGLVPAAAYADPISLAATLGPILGSAIGGTVASALAFVGANAVAIGFLASSIYGSVASRRKAKNAAADARARYNAELEDRTTTVLSTIPPWQIVYGRATIPGSIHAMFTSDKIGVRSDGTSYTKADAMRYLVYVFAAHECSQVHDVKINGEPCGPFDADGWSLNSRYALPENKNPVSVLLAPGGSFTAGHPMTIVSTLATDESSTNYETAYNYLGNGTYTLTNGDKTVTNTTAGGYSLYVNYYLEAPTASLGVRLHLGSSSQTVDTYLQSLFPEKWTVNHRIRGRLYAVVTLDLENPDFQSGPPQITVDVSGKLVYDPRNATTAFSSNNALCTRDFLLAKWGAEAVAAEVDDSLCIAAANACDVSISLKVPGYADQLSYTFDSTVEGFVGTNATLSVVSGALRIDGTGKDPYVSKTLSASGATSRYVRVRIKRVAGDSWQGVCRYSTSGHGYSSSYFKRIDGGFPVGGAYQDIVFDMHDLTKGGGDWKSSTITGIQLRLGKTKEDTFDVDAVYLSSFAEVTVTESTYSLNGMFRTDSSREGILDQMARSMAGTVTDSGKWVINAGSWTAPVKDFADADLFGQIEFVQADTGMEDLLNSVRGTYFPQSSSTPVDFQPYKNATLITSDGEELWGDIALPFTNYESRARNLARILVERQRNGQIIRVPLQLHAWPIQVGDRVRITSTEYGLSLKTYRVTDWNFDLTTPVVLTMQEDTAETYDTTDTTLVDPTRNTNLPSPSQVPEVEGLTVASGTPHLIRMSDGTIQARAFISWDLSEDRYVSTGSAIVEVKWQRIGKEPASTWHRVEVPATSDSVYITNVREGETLQVIARHVNNAGRPGAWEYAALHTILGKDAPPSDVTGLVATKVTNGLRIDWTACPDSDYSETELRRGGSGWSDAVPLAGSVSMAIKGNSYLWVPAAGSYTIRAKHRDTSGNESITAASVAVTVSDTDLLEWADVAGRPALYRAGALGGNTVSGHPIGPGLYDAETGTLLRSAARSYNVMSFTRSTGALSSVTTHDIYSGGGAPAAMAAALNALGSDKIVVILTHDEPQANRLSNGLAEAMYRCGASRAVYGSPNFKYRAAYALIGIPGCGEGQGYEAYQGDVDDSTNAWLDVSFYLQNGNFVISGTSHTPSTLKDYSYTGTLDATTDAAFVSTGTVALTGNSAFKTLNNSTWDTQVYSRDGHSGGAFVSAMPANTSGHVLFGLNTDPTTDASFASIDFAIYLNTSVTVVYESGSSVYTGAAYAATDVFTVAFDGFKVRYLKNGTVFYTSSATPSSTTKFHFDSSFYGASGLNNMRFGPMSGVTDIGTPQLLVGAVTQPIRTDNADTYLYNSSAVVSFSGTRNGSNITTTANGRVFMSATGRVYVILNTTSARNISVWLKLQLVDTSSGTVVDESGYITSSHLAVVDNVLLNSWVLCPVSAALLFDAAAADTYTPRLSIYVSCYYAGVDEASIIQVAHYGEVSAVEFKV